MAKTKFPIKDGEPVPHRKAPNIRYPWHSLEVGQSFLVPLDKRETVAAGATDFGKRHKRKFTIRTSPAGVRVWRTA